MNYRTGQPSQSRRADLGRRRLNGIDSVEVIEEGGAPVLLVRFFEAAPEALSENSVEIDGGQRVQGISATAVTRGSGGDPDDDRYAKIYLDREGDSSRYTLRISGLPGFDPTYSRAYFRFETGISTGMDCITRAPAGAAPPEEPEISYLAKDYASFRQLILDRWTLTIPDWDVSHTADLGIALAEIFAYTGDRLSYYQDAVATEAYLNTARSRISIRRHARLVDYRIHEGCNARAWVALEVGQDLPEPLDPRQLYFITSCAAQGAAAVMSENAIAGIPWERYEVFEAVDSDPLVLFAAHNRLRFHTWGDRAASLPCGATGATLVDGWEGSGESQQGERRLRHLKPGDVLILMEVRGPATGDPADADRSHRHAVRLTAVDSAVDEVYQQPILNIRWDPEDALPFQLTICSSRSPTTPEGEDVSIAVGNIVLVDHGRRVWETLSATPQCVLSQHPLTFREPAPPKGPASRTLLQDPRRAFPQLELRAGAEEPSWSPRYDLLASGPTDPHFVVEMDDEGLGHIRFGDGQLGRTPPTGASFDATYRIGNGHAGNVGADAIAHLILRQGVLTGVDIRVGNPLPAAGGRGPEPAQEIRMLAPGFARTELERGATADDYATLAARHPSVQNGAASLDWTGSRNAVRVAVQLVGGEDPTPDLLDAIKGFLYRYRRIGHDLEVVPVATVPIHLELAIRVHSEYRLAPVRAALLAVFGDGILPGGAPALFHRSNWNFGGSVYVSRLVAAAQAVAGVESVEVVRLQRMFGATDDAVDRGVLAIGPMEIARMDNDASAPENGRLTLRMEGGR